MNVTNFNGNPSKSRVETFNSKVNHGGIRGKRIIKVFRIHPLGTMNVEIFMAIHFNVDSH